MHKFIILIILRSKDLRESLIRKRRIKFIPSLNKTTVNTCSSFIIRAFRERLNKLIRLIDLISFLFLIHILLLTLLIQLILHFRNILNFPFLGILLSNLRLSWFRNFNSFWIEKVICWSIQSKFSIR